MPRDGTVVETFTVEIDDEPVRGNRRRSKVSMLACDALLLVVEHVQIYALILSLSLAWPWPYDWIKVTSVAFFVNLDLWEFTKVHTVYESQTQAYEDPNNIPFSYLAYAIVWLSLAVLMPVVFAAVYLFSTRIPGYGPLDVIIFRAKLTRIFLLATQILTLPFGLTVARLVDCQIYTDTLTGEEQYRSIVLKDTLCWSATHFGILVPLATIALAYVVGLLFWMLFRIRRELISTPLCTCSTWETYHEQNVLLKETEYLHEVDLSWATHHYSLFSSFRRRWVWYRPFSLLIKVVIVGVYGGLFYLPIIQAIVLFSITAILSLTVLVLPPYRVRLFSFMLTFSIFANLCNLSLGMLLRLGVQNALLFGQNLVNSLLVINLAWCLVAFIWLTYIYLRSRKIIGKRLGPLWPVMPEMDSTNLFRDEHTEKFFKSLLNGRRLLEKCYSSTPFFAPVHELVRHIHIINVYSREAEVLEDPSHSSLWALLAEMVDTHSRLAPQSVYGMSAAGRVPHKIQRLMELMPALKKRLDQREYDFILWTPLKKRILFKLFAASTFVRRRNTRVKIPVQINYPHLSAHRASTLSFLKDDCEVYNEQFLIDIEKWEAQRKKSLFPSDDDPTTMIGALDSDRELYEDGLRFAEAHRQKRSYSIQSNTSVDRLLNEVENWQTLHQITSLGAAGPQEYDPEVDDHDVGLPGDVAPQAAAGPGRKSTRFPSSRLNVRFNLLDTITEQDGDPVQHRVGSAISSVGSGLSFNSTDRLIRGVEENFS